MIKGIINKIKYRNSHFLLAVFVLGLSCFASLFNLTTNQPSLFYDEVNSTLSYELVRLGETNLGLRSTIQTIFIRQDGWQSYFFPILRAGGQFDTMVLINRIPAAISMLLSAFVLFQILKELKIKIGIVFLGVILYSTSGFYLLQSHFLSLIGFYVLYSWLFILFWIKFSFNEESKRRNFLFSIIFGGLATYTHILALVFIVSTGFFIFVFSNLNLIKNIYTIPNHLVINIKNLLFIFLSLIVSLTLLFPTANDVFINPQNFASAKQSHTFLSYVTFESEINQYIIPEFFTRAWAYLSPNYLVFPDQLSESDDLENIYVFSKISNPNNNKWVTEVISPFGFISGLFYAGIALVFINLLSKNYRRQHFKILTVIIALLISYVITSVIPNYGNPSLSKTGPANLVIILGILYLLNEVWNESISLGELLQKPLKMVTTTTISVLIVVNALVNFSYINSFAYTRNEADKFDYGYRQIAEYIINQNLLSFHPTIFVKDNLWSKEKHLEYYLGPYILNSVVQLGVFDKINPNIISPQKKHLLVTKYQTDEEDLKQLNIPYAWQEYRIAPNQQKVLYLAVIGDFPTNQDIISVKAGNLIGIRGNYRPYRRVSDYNLFPHGYYSHQLDIQRSNPRLVPKNYFSDLNKSTINKIQPIFDFQNATLKNNQVKSNITIDQNLIYGKSDIWFKNDTVNFSIKVEKLNSCDFEMELNQFYPSIGNASLDPTNSIGQEIKLDSKMCQKINDLAFFTGDQFLRFTELIDKDTEFEFDSSKSDFSLIDFYLPEASYQIDPAQDINTKIIECESETQKAEFKSRTSDTKINGFQTIELQTVKGSGCIKQNLELNSGSDLFLVKPNFLSLDELPTRFTFQKENEEANYIDFISTRKDGTEYNQEQFILNPGKYNFYQYSSEGTTRFFGATDVFGLNKTNLLKPITGSTKTNSYKNLGSYINYINEDGELNLNADFEENIAAPSSQNTKFSDCTPYESSGGKSSGKIDAGVIQISSSKQVICAKIRLFNLKNGTYSINYDYKNISGYSPSVCVLDLKSDQCIESKIVSSGIKTNSYQSFFQITNQPQIEVIINNYAGGNFFDTKSSNQITNFGVKKSRLDFLNNFFISNFDLNTAVDYGQPINTIIEKSSDLTQPYKLNFKTKERCLYITTGIVFDPNWRLKIGDQEIAPNILNDSYLGWNIDLQKLNSQGVVVKSDQEEYFVESSIFYKFNLSSKQINTPQIERGN
jgi:hypothetical protein